MTCPSCSHENRPGAKFCGGCGAALKRACAKCGSELPDGVRFCDECGARVPGAAPAPRPAEADAARKIVTLLFADLIGSTALHERLDPESARRFMESYYALAREAVESHGGTLAKLLGDGALAVFGIPRVAEDDAIRAVRAAVAMQEGFRALAEQQRGLVGETGLRVAVNTGEVVVKGETEIIGDPVNVAARLQERGRDSDVVIGESTRRLVATQVTLESLGALDLKGRAEAVRAYRVTSLAAAGRAAAPFVGREEELGRIAAVYEKAVAAPATHLAVLLGSPGLGKSRLIAEFVRRSGEAATVIDAHCDVAGGATFAPLADAIRELLGIETGASPEAVKAAVDAALPRQRGADADAAADCAASAERTRIAAGIAGILAGSPGAPEETFFVVRRFLAGLATERPVTLVIDDLQWGEPLLFDLVEHLVQWGRSLPLLVLVGARPELREIRSSFATPGGLVADVVMLSGLDASVAMRLAAGVIGAADLPSAVAAKVLASSEGNPLFIGELVRMLVDEGALVRDGDRWTTGEALATVEMPPTIHALLAARIERLEPEQCVILERAAVVGRQFSRSAVAALLAGGGNGARAAVCADASGLDSQFEALQRAQLIERDTGWYLGEPVLRFHHVLTRDAAYRRLLKRTRAELHERLADWIEARVGDAPEHDETVGRHLEESHRLLGELGPVDAAGQRLGDRASARLAAAGRRALDGDDVPLAAGLFGRALERLTQEDPARADLSLEWCEALLAAGDVANAATAIDELSRYIERIESVSASGPEAQPSEAASRLRAWHTCFAGHHTVLAAPEDLSATVESVAAAATALASLDDAAGEAKGHFVHALALARLGRVGACEASLDHALAAARRAGDRRRANTVLAIAPVAALWGPSPVTRASGRCLDVVRVLRITQGAPAVEAVALSCQGVLEALRGRTDAAGRMIASGRRMVEELGIAQRLFEADVSAGFVAMLEGDSPAAARTLREAYDGLRDLGLGIDAARAAALLARALLAEDRIDEAEALSHDSEALAGDDLKAAIAWRGVRAEVLARRGRHEAAIEFARAAVEIAAATDAPLDHADARLALAAALRASGRAAEADAERRRAIELWEAKGASRLVERAWREASAAAAPVAAAATSVATPAPPVAQAPRRRLVRDNFAIEETRRIEAAVDSKDLQALADVYLPVVEIVDHMHGLDYGREEVFDRVRAQIQESIDGTFRHEALATLGKFVGLSRLRGTATSSEVYGVPIGETEIVYLLVIEADEKGCARRIDIFGEDALSDAIVKLYERHAALEPEGPARARAEGTARTVRALRTPFDPDVLAPVVDADMETVDHRTLGTWSAEGGREALKQIRGLRDVASDAEVRDEDILGIEAGALLTRRMHSGTERVGGGAYERPFLLLAAFGFDGRLKRWEFFDVGQQDEALARFEALVAAGRTRAPVRRRLRANASSRLVQDIEAGFAARDRGALEKLLSDPLHTIEHPTGVTYGREGQLESIDRMLRLPNLDFRMEMLATLGDGLGLARRHVTASGTGGGRFDVAEFEQDHIVLTDLGEDGLWQSEVFAPNRLADAIVRLYELYADSLPEGPERARAAGVARTLSVLDGPVDPGSLAEAYAADIRLDDRRVLGTWSSESRAELITHFLHQLELVRDYAMRTEDVLALEPDRLFVRLTYYGTGRDSGGDFENRICVVYRFGRDGRVEHIDCFEAEREADALALFDRLAIDAPGAGALRRARCRSVRPNAATRICEGFQRTVSARDAAGLQSLLARDLRFEHRPTGATYGAREFMGTWRGAFKAEQLQFELEVLASLGDRVALHRHRVAVEGLTESAMADFGRSELHEVVVVEADEAGLCRRIDLYAPERLGHAIVRLYEFYADSLPEGPERTRAAGRARSIAVYQGPLDVESITAVTDPASRNLDHRVFGTWTMNGRAEIVRHYRQQLELAPDFAARWDDVLALGPDALLVGMTFFGTARESGGAFENPLWQLWTFTPDGRLGNTETFEIDQEREALARFDEIAEAGAPARTPAKDPFANRATRVVGRFAVANARHDWPALRRLFAPDYDFDDRRPLLRLRLSREGFLEQYRTLFDVPNSRWDNTVIATRGERLSLTRSLFHGDTDESGGPLEIDHLIVSEVARDGEGIDRFVAGVLFAPDDLDAAFAELDALYEAGEAATPSRNRCSLSGFVRAVERRNWGAVRALCSDDFVERDHRGFAVLGGTEGADAWAANFRTLVELAPDTVYRARHILEAERGYFVHGSWYGTREGGPYELQVNAVLELDAAGRIRRADMYDDGVTDAALDRLAELSDPARSSIASQRFANAAARAVERGTAALAARDWEGFAALMAPGFRHYDRTRMAQLESAGDEWLVAFRRIVEMTSGPPASKLLATRGDRLALFEMLWRGARGDVGPSEIDWCLIVEVDEQGRHVAIVAYDPEDLDAAYRELDDRYEIEQGERLPVSWALFRRWTHAVAERDWGTVASVCADDIVEHDHRGLSVLGVTKGIEDWIEVIRAVSDLAPDSVFRVRHFVPGERGYYQEGGFVGTQEGGDFEIVINSLVEIDGGGLLRRVDLYDDDRVFADSRWAELGIPAEPVAEASGVGRSAESLLGAGTSASAAVERWMDTYRTGFETGNWDAMREMCAPEFSYSDRRRLNRLEGNVEMLLASARERAEAGASVRLTPVGAAGDRIVVQKVLWAGGPADGRFEIEYLALSEMDSSGRIVAFVLFDLDDARAAHQEAFERLAAIDGSVNSSGRTAR